MTLSPKNKQQFVVPISPKLKTILDREEALLAEHTKFCNVAFETEKQKRLDASRRGDASAKDIKAAAEVYDNTLGNYFDGQRNALDNVLAALRSEAYRTFCDDIAVPVLAELQRRKEELADAVASLNAKFEGAGVRFNQDWLHHRIDFLEEMIFSETPSPGFLHQSLNEVVAGCRI
jgi:cell division protein FtsI/penicillin-binding protein 2